MIRSTGFLKIAAVAAALGAGSLLGAPSAQAFGGGFHGGPGGFHGGGFHGGGWGVGGWGGPVFIGGWGPGIGWGYGPSYGWDDGWGYGSTCTLRRVAVRTAWGLRWRTVQVC